MNYQTFQPHPDLQALVKCYWTLEVPAEHEAPKQRIIADGCLEMAFVLGDDIRRYTSETNFVLQPRSMVIGQITKPFFIQPTGYVNTFAIRFYPYGFANFIEAPIKSLSDKETSLAELFGERVAQTLEQFLLSLLNQKSTVDKIIHTTIDALVSTKGNLSISTLLKNDLAQRRQLERKFSNQIGISPKQLAKVMRLQAALKMLLHNRSEKLSTIAYEGEYYDQAHFIRDFKDFTGTNPSAFLSDKSMQLSALIYKKE